MIVIADERLAQPPTVSLSSSSRLPESLLAIAPEVSDALAVGRPVVALESTLITHGLPHPLALDAARRAEAAVRAGGAVPATIAVADGRIRVGLTSDELEALAAEPAPWKVSRQNLAASLGRAGWSGTTVAATMIAAHGSGISVFATGGIGGVHRGGGRSMDVSADLDELARTPVAVVCAGPKSILDVALTMEVLETRGVPVVGWGTHELAGFFSTGSGQPVPMRIDSAGEAAALARRHWALGLGSGLLFAVPLSSHQGIPRDEMEAVIARAEAEATRAGVFGPATTPWILSRLAELTGGRTVAANLALIENDAHIAASLAVALRQA